MDQLCHAHLVISFIAICKGLHLGCKPPALDYMYASMHSVTMYYCRLPTHEQGANCFKGSRLLEIPHNKGERAHADLAAFYAMTWSFVLHQQYSARYAL